MPTSDPAADVQYQITDELWARIAPLLPPGKPKKKPGRPRMDDRKAMAAVLYVLRTRCPWKALPRSIGAGSTVYDRFREWRQAHVFERMQQNGLFGYRELAYLSAACLTEGEG